MVSDNMNITDLVRAHLDVFYEIERRDVVFRRAYDDARRRAKCPWIMAGRKELAEQEYEIWVKLQRGAISDHDAIEQLTALMEQYYGVTYTALYEIAIGNS